MARPFRDRLDQAKSQSLGHLLLKSARLFNEHALAQVREETGLDVRPVHTAMFPHIDLEGTRLTDLAERMGITRQAVARYVADLEAHALVERIPDPDDRRASLVRFTDSGREQLLGGLRVLGLVEARTAQKLGPERVELLRRTLADLVDLLESP
ncbi:MAG: MarR family transcriptional regulator [Deltaproteobacteria bacterium]|nr:MAG: MarR family transcriptional regulator [Deltaproteobacteria bacterium]